MITPYLEKLIHCGKATPKTHVIGGAQKCVIDVPDDKYIIIHNIVHFPYYPNEEEVIGEILQKQTTQMQVFSDGSYNNFVFRNSINYALNLSPGGTLVNNRQFGGEVNLDVYLIHKDDVSFSFSYATDLTTSDSGVAPANSVAKRPVTDYGKDGINTAIGNFPVSRKRDYAFPSTFTSELRPLGDVTQPTAGKNTSTKELQFPIDDNTRILDSDIEFRSNYPVVLVQYVLIDGTPQNLRQQA